jgi:hypothetical protein
MGFSSPGFLAAVQFRKGRRRGGRKVGGIIEDVVFLFGILWG